MSIHTQPWRQLVAAAVLVVGATACGSDGDRTVTPTAPQAPSPPAPPPAPPSEGRLVTGTVIEFTSAGERRSVPNLRLRVRDGGTRSGAVGGVELADVVTDKDGRYEIPNVTAFVLFFSIAPGSSHRFLCDQYPLFMLREPTSPGFPNLSDLLVVSASWSGDRLPPGMWSIGTSVYGTVSERIDGTMRPVAGATVTLDSGNQDPPATTSATGFYMVCSVVGTDQLRTITARKAGYTDTVRQIFGGWDFDVHLELARR
jgi:hypothetical protein